MGPAARTAVSGKRHMFQGDGKRRLDHLNREPTCDGYRLHIRPSGWQSAGAELVKESAVQMYISYGSVCSFEKLILQNFLTNTSIGMHVVWPTILHLK